MYGGNSYALKKNIIITGNKTNAGQPTLGRWEVTSISVAQKALLWSVILNNAGF